MQKGVLTHGSWIAYTDINPGGDSIYKKGRDARREF